MNCKDLRINIRLKFCLERQLRVPPKTRGPMVGPGLGCLAFRGVYVWDRERQALVSRQRTICDVSCVSMWLWRTLPPCDDADAIIADMMRTLKKPDEAMIEC